MIKKIIYFLFVTLIIATACKKTDNTDYAVRDQKIIADYLKAKGLTAQVTASGLNYIIEDSGNYNKRPGTLTSYIVAGYKGYLTNDTVFNDTVASTAMALSTMIQGWQEGIKLVGLGGKIKLIIPSTLGYAGESQAKIPAHSVLIFNIGLVDYY